MYKCLTIATALLAALPAGASSSAEARLGPLAVQLLDLDPDDGITPWVQFSADTSFSSRASAVSFNPYGVFDDDAEAGAGAWGDASAAVALALSRAAASVSGGGADGHGASLQATGSSIEYTDTALNLAQYSASVRAPGLFAGAFTLSAATQLTVSGWGSVLAQVSNIYPQFHDFASADVLLTLGGASDSLAARCQALSGQAPCRQEDARLLSLSFANTSGASVTGSLLAETRVAGYSYASVVPEPASQALMLAGLAALGWAARQRQPPH